jgi:D-sedoheptulose 7-phosphate isomerase
MSNVENFFLKSDNNFVSFSKAYLNYLQEIIHNFPYDDLNDIYDEFLLAKEKGRNIFFIGNGGSASTASHFASDFTIGVRSKSNGFKAIALTDNNAVITAIGNDYGYENIFKEQLIKLINKDDVVFAISASGNSPNIIRALEYANEQHCMTISLTGFDGGICKKISKINLNIPTPNGDYGPVEDFHLIVDHILHNYFKYLCR